MNKLKVILFSALFSLKIQAQSVNDSALYFCEKKQFDKAIKYSIKTNDFNKIYYFGNKLYQDKDYTNSLVFYLKYLELAKPYLNNQNQLLILNIIGHNYQSINDYINSENYYLEAYNLNSKINGVEDESNIKFLSNLIVVFDNQKKFNETTKCYQQILKIKKSKLGEFNSDYTNTMFSTGWAFVDSKFFDEAESYFLKALKIESNFKDTLSIEYSVSLFNLFIFYRDHKIDFEKAKYYIDEVIRIKKNLLGEKNSDFLDSYEMLGFLYESHNQFDNALKVFNDVLALRKSSKNKSYIVTFNSVIRVICNINKNEKFDYTENLCKTYIDEAMVILGKKSEFYQTGLMYLASFYEKNDILYKAENYYQELISLKKDSLQKSIVEVFPEYESLANIYSKEGNSKLSKTIHKYVLDKKIENKFSQDEIARSYNNLASVYMNELNYDSAITNYLLAINLIKTNFSEFREDFGTYLNNLGVLYLKTKNYKSAEECLTKAIKIQEKLQGQFGEQYLLVCSNLASLYYKLNRCKEALHYFTISINNCKNKKSANYKYRFLGISSVYSCLNDLSEEKKYLILSSKYFREDILSICYNYTSTKQDLLLFNILRSKNYPLSFLVRNSNHSDIVEVALDEDLLINHLSLNNQKRLEISILESNDSTLKVSYNKFINNRRLLYELDELSTNNSENTDSLILETENIENYLVQHSKEFSKSKKLLSIKWKDLKTKIKSNEIIIDIVNFKFENNNLVDSVIYGAFVIHNNQKEPKFISLFNENELTILLSRKENISDSNFINNQYHQNLLSNLFLSKLSYEFKDVKTIYLSLSGLSYQVNFSALPVDSNMNFGEKYKLHILNSPTEIFDEITELHIDKNNEVLLYGGIDYNNSNDNDLRLTPLNNENNSEYNDNSNNLETRSGVFGFGYLNSTNKEIDLINKKANSLGYKSTIFKGGNATEESIKNMNKKSGPFIIHLATHGFFFNDIPKDTFDYSLEQTVNIHKTSENPMIRSGIILSGANNFWGKPKNKPYEDDGILTANEISNLDLKYCQLVVLSACETGLGKIIGNEGVFGLQRGFKMAGVKNIIMSLWKIPDIETALFFDLFYSDLFSGKSVRESFTNSQAKMRLKYSPYYWAGFVLLE